MRDVDIVGSVGVKVDLVGILLDIIGIWIGVFEGFRLLLDSRWLLFFFIWVLLLVE